MQALFPKIRNKGHTKSLAHPEEYYLRTRLEREIADLLGERR
jgi:hypothetical protein